MANAARINIADHRAPEARDAWAATLGISRAAIDLYLSSEPIDLHVDSFIWTRIFGYDLRERHGHGLLGARFYSQADLPRLREAQLSGAVFIISTNPFRSTSGRSVAFAKNFARLKAILESVPDEVMLVRTTAEFRAARAAGKFAAFLGIQGGNALDRDSRAIEALDDHIGTNAAFSSIQRVTLVHLSNSRVGGTSAPLGGGRGLSDIGRELIAALNQRHIFVDLAHISKKGFWDAIEAHDKSQPAIVTHTGVSGVHEHWRNLDDDQVRAISKSGGVVGVMYQSSFLGDPLFAGRAESIVRHLEHIVKVAGEEAPALGSDWDGSIITPRDMRTCLELPRLVQLMLDRSWPEERVVRVLGGNFLQALSRLRG